MVLSFRGAITVLSGCVFTLVIATPPARAQSLNLKQDRISGREERIDLREAGRNEAFERSIRPKLCQVMRWNTDAGEWNHVGTAFEVAQVERDFLLVTASHVLEGRDGKLLPEGDFQFIIESPDQREHFDRKTVKFHRHPDRRDGSPSDRNRGPDVALVQLSWKAHEPVPVNRNSLHLWCPFNYRQSLLGREAAIAGYQAADPGSRPKVKYRTAKVDGHRPGRSDDRITYPNPGVQPGWSGAPVFCTYQGGGDGTDAKEIVIGVHVEGVDSGLCRAVHIFRVREVMDMVNRYRRTPFDSPVLNLSGRPCGPSKESSGNSSDQTTITRANRFPPTTRPTNLPVNPIEPEAQPAGELLMLRLEQEIDNAAVNDKRIRADYKRSNETVVYQDRAERYSAIYSALDRNISPVERLRSEDYIVPWEAYCLQACAANQVAINIDRIGQLRLSRDRRKFDGWMKAAGTSLEKAVHSGGQQPIPIIVTAWIQNNLAFPGRRDVSLTADQRIRFQWVDDQMGYLLDNYSLTERQYAQCAYLRAFARQFLHGKGAAGDYRAARDAVEDSISAYPSHQAYGLLNELNQASGRPSRAASKDASNLFNEFYDVYRMYVSRTGSACAVCGSD